MFHFLRRKVSEYFHDFLVACWAVLRLPFQLFGIGWRSFFSLGFRKVLMLFVAVVVVTVVLVVVFVEATSQPGFCVQCHVMEPYFKAWETSQHKDVSCIKCHMNPGLEGTVHAKFMAISMLANYATGLYKRSKPWAEIDDASCLRGGCHETRLLNGKVKFKGVTFDHEPHLTQPRRDRQLRCTSCHAQIVQGAHISVTEATCFLCHLKPDSMGERTELARCTHCHTPPTGPAAADSAFDHTSVLDQKVDCLNCHSRAVVGNGYVAPDRCSFCHAEVEHLQRFSDRDFVHQKHVTERKVECEQCHAPIRHGKEVKLSQARLAAQECAKCHGGADDAIEKVWFGTLPGIPETPSRMAQIGQTCSSCHIEPVHPDGHLPSAPSCEPCHPPEYNRLPKLWKTSLLSALDELERSVKTLPPAERDTLLNAIRIYRKGHPHHNPDLLGAIEKRAGVKVTDEGRCVTCHPAARELTPLHNGRPFPHGTHLKQGLDCQSCHETETGKHGTLKLAEAECNACHHKQAVTNTTLCVKCHSLQRDVYTGAANLTGQSQPSAMSEADIKCTECHTVKDKVITRKAAAACVACHEASYEKTLTEWQTQGDELLQTLSSRMRALSRHDSAYSAYEKLLKILKQDGSKTVHNPELFGEWMKRLKTAN
jgi:nitrate/TMAO reductase-like tetraheme cytochrome c subunit